MTAKEARKLTQDKIDSLDISNHIKEIDDLIMTAINKPTFSICIQRPFEKYGVCESSKIQDYYESKGFFVNIAFREVFRETLTITWKRIR